MILEVVDLRVDPARQTEFEAAVAHGVATVIAASPGFVDHQLQRCLETPGRYLLLIRWRTLADHTVTFRGGPAFVAWRAIVGPFFAAPPAMEHFELAGQTAG